MLLELMRRGAETGWVRTTDGCEVDFLARHADGSKELIQVCAGADSAATMDREIRALQSALPEHRQARATVITLHPESFSMVPQGITVISAVEWLLDPPAV